MNKKRQKEIAQKTAAILAFAQEADRRVAALQGKHGSLESGLEAVRDRLRAVDEQIADIGLMRRRIEELEQQVAALADRVGKGEGR